MSVSQSSLAQPSLAQTQAGPSGSSGSTGSIQMVKRSGSRSHLPFAPPQKKHKKSQIKQDTAGFEEYIRSDSCTLQPFADHPNIAINSSAFELLVDSAKNDVLAFTGSAIIGAHFADVLYRLLFLPPSESDGLDPNGIIRLRIQMFTADESYSCFEALTGFYGENSPLAQIGCRSLSTRLPRTKKSKKRSANRFKANVWYRWTMFNWEGNAAFYKDILNDTVPFALNDFESQFSSLGSHHYLQLVNRSRNAELDKVHTLHEQKFLHCMETRAYDLLSPLLGHLKSAAADDQLVEFNQRNQVIGPCRPMVQLGGYLFQSRFVTQCDACFPSHRLAKEGGLDVSTAICSLAGCRGLMNLVARWAELDKSAQGTLFSDDKLASIFLVATAKLWIKDPGMFRKVMQKLTLAAILFSSQVLREAGIKLEIIVPDNNDNDLDDVDIDADEVDPNVPDVSA